MALLLSLIACILLENGKIDGLRPDWSDCVVTTEICDGLDNDCNGMCRNNGPGLADFRKPRFDVDTMLAFRSSIVTAGTWT